LTSDNALSEEALPFKSSSAISQGEQVVDPTSSRQPIVLVVEDIEEIRFGMKNSLLGCGYCVLEAADANEAVAVASRWPPDLIFTEEELPTFAALMARAREHPSLKGLPVVIVNPDAEEGARYAEAVVLADYDQLKLFLLSQARLSDEQ
jgi:CheY-like chemotaxis protein